MTLQSSDLLIYPSRVQTSDVLAGLQRTLGFIPDEAREWLPELEAASLEGDVDFAYSSSHSANETDFFRNPKYFKGRKNGFGIGVTGEPGVDGPVFPSWMACARFYVAELRMKLRLPVGAFADARQYAPQKYDDVAALVKDPPHASWMLVRGMKTLAVRVARQNENALRVANFLEQHAKVRRVHYPFLKSHQQHGLAVSQMSGGGGMVTFEVEGTGEDARRVSEGLRLFTLAPSLGGVESLVCIPVLTSHLSVPEDERRKMGVTEQMIRLSVGIESADDLVADLEQALKSVGAAAAVTVG